MLKLHKKVLYPDFRDYSILFSRGQWAHGEFMTMVDATLLIVDRKIRSSHPCILAKEMAHNILESPSSVDICRRAEFLNES